LEYDKRKLKEETQEEFKVLAFFGTWNGIEYPDGYTSQQRRLIGLTDSWFLKIKRKGELCNAGHTSALLFPDGKVARCGQIGERFIIGNFFDPEFKLHSKPLICDVDYCPCAEYSVTGDENAAEDNASKTSTVEIKENAKPAASEKVNISDLLSINRSLSLLNDKISFAWDIHYSCNFRCPYCWFFDNWAQQAKRNLYLTPQEWMVIWKRIFDKYGETRIAITGGEPFLYPNFIELVRELSSLHIVKITTNMSGNIEKFIQEISPKRVYLDLNFHAAFVRDLNGFIRKVKLLHNAGFGAGVCYLAYPPQLGMIDFYKKRFEENDIRFALAAFWGKYQDRQYPESYTPEEKEMIKPFLGDVGRIDYHLNAASPKDKPCNAGYKYANIHGDGTVVRCAQYADTPIGNILDYNFQLFSAPLLCGKKYCPGNEYDNIIGC
jgi:MoaA/NifB/PqqE/SkfB family radical SAM enzyme